MNPARGIKDRNQKIAFYGAIFGLIINAALLALYVSGGELDTMLIVNNMIYNLVLIGIICSSYFNFKFRLVTLSGILIMYAHIWATTFHEGMVGETTVLSLPVVLFSPQILILLAGWRVLSLVAIAQAIMVYYYTRSYGAQFHGADWSATDHSTYSMALPFISLMTVGMLAVIAYTRERTDRRLFAVIKEKERLAAEDPLTGLLNRRSFIEKLERNWTEALPVAVAFIDLDRFKPLNDEYGHAVGDVVLETIGERLQNLDGITMAARFGGDEFAVLIETNNTSRSPDAICEDMYREICADIATDGGLVGVGASIGFAAAPFDADNTASLLHLADTAMLRIKDSGGGVTRFNQDVDGHTLASSAMEIVFRDALYGGKIRPALQPIADAHTGEIIGHELLARWVDSGFQNDPAPADFIPIAERLGLLNELLTVTLEQVFSAGIKRKHFLSVNVSPSQLSNPNFFIPLLRILAKYEVAPSHLELEVTEQIAFRNNDHNVMMLEKARELGFTVALDDFGTGYSSLSMLDKLPLDKLKIDRSFISDRDSRSRSDDVLSATIKLAKKLGLTCCIEGVETEATAQHMRKLGCDQMQGYWIGFPDLVASPPMPKTDDRPLRLVS